MEREHATKSCGLPNCREKALRHQRSLAAIAGGQPKSIIVEEFEASSKPSSGRSVAKLTAFCQEGRIRVEHHPAPGTETADVWEFDALGGCAVLQVGRLAVIHLL